VIFGAGASYDSDPSYPSGQSDDENARLPLADQLFADRPIFSTALKRFPLCHAIIPYLRNRANNISVEQVLENLQEESQARPLRHKQLAAVRFYLHLMLWECERRWKEVTKHITSNYRTLLDQIEHHRSLYDRVCLVTFNYDTLLDSEFPSVARQIETMFDYVFDENYKLIKVHGSINWAREVRTPIDGLHSKNTWQVGQELIDRADSLDVSANYRIVTTHPTGLLPEPRIPIFPALAIPVQRKQTFECPADHIALLRECIAQTTKLLFIGWRATEYHFMELLKMIRSGTRGLVVAGGKANAEEVIERLNREGVQANWFHTEGGFTDFVAQRVADKFLR
jgi:hypothetical protein